ncbi:MAG TPA: RnfABCDGE type electron transport complex subunit D [Chitinophagales bacterium]|nr:RnfABCDGE type electron transport complex subunit D [Chitinophagales bacterium]
MQSISFAKEKPLSDFLHQFVDWFNSDPRHYQIIFLSVFLFYGIAGLNWEVNTPNLLLTFFTCFITQSIFTAVTTQDYRSLKSAAISALSLCLMLKTNSPFVIVLASVLTISSKFIFRFPFFPLGRSKGAKHFFNPTNFGIIVTILLTHNAWISPGQWGSNGLLVFSIGLLGLVVLLRVKRLDTAIAFLFTFCSLSFIRSVVVLGWQPDFFLHQFTSGTLLLFSFFMITDPVSTPSHPYARIAWATLVGLLAFFLGTYEFVNGAPLWALFFLSPLTILLDKIFVHSKFQWV